MKKYLRVLSIATFMLCICVFLFGTYAYSEEHVKKQITSNSYDDNDCRINDQGYVVWVHNGSDDEIYLYDGSSTISLTSNSTDDNDPDINGKGQVVWEHEDGAIDEYIYMTMATLSNLPIILYMIATKQES